MSTTVDNTEIAHFDALSSEWWDEKGKMRALHTMNALRVPWIGDNVTRGGSILDVGCGAGLLSEPLARIGLNVTAVDASRDCIAVAQKRLCNNNLPIEYLHQNVALEEATGGREFDAVVASEVVEHVSDVGEFLTCLSTHVRPGGTLFMTTINRTTVANLLAIYAAEYVLRIVPRGTHQYDKFVTPDEVTARLQALDMSPSPARGMMYNPVCNSWSWTSFTDVNYALMAVKKS